MSDSNSSPADISSSAIRAAGASVRKRFALRFTGVVGEANQLVREWRLKWSRFIGDLCATLMVSRLEARPVRIAPPRRARSTVCRIRTARRNWR